MVIVRQSIACVNLLNDRKTLEKATRKVGEFVGTNDAVGSLQRVRTVTGAAIIL
jgi:hypothetical protein